MISNRSSAQGLARAANAGIPTKIIPHKEFADREAFDRALDAALAEAEVELVCLAGFMRLLTPWFIGAWSGRMLNIHPALLPQQTGAARITLVNDFAAVAHAVAWAAPSDFAHLCGPDRPLPASGTISVVGPGTGLGVAHLWRGGGGECHVQPTEGGHVSFAPLDPVDDAILARLRRHHGRVSAERVVSGPGLVNLYICFSARRGITLTARVGANEITRRALAGEDPVATESLDFFVKALGRIAGDTALTMGARGGVYLGGGIPPKILDFLAKPAFRQAFESKGRLSPFLKPIPVYVMLARDAGLRGTAVALETALAEGRI